VPAAGQGPSIAVEVLLKGNCRDWLTPSLTLHSGNPRLPAHRLAPCTHNPHDVIMRTTCSNMCTHSGLLRTGKAGMNTPPGNNVGHGRPCGFDAVSTTDTTEASLFAIWACAVLMVLMVPYRTCPDASLHDLQRSAGEQVLPTLRVFACTQPCRAGRCLLQPKQQQERGCAPDVAYVAKGEVLILVDLQGSQLPFDGVICWILFPAASTMKVDARASRSHGATAGCLPVRACTGTGPYRCG
jgi:hypothetical protein